MLRIISYKKFIHLCKQNPYKDLCDYYLVNITTSEQFFKIILEILNPNSGEQILFLNKHEEILNKNNLYNKITPELDHHLVETKLQIEEIEKTEKFIEDTVISILPFALPIVPVYPISFITIMSFAALYRVQIIDKLKDEIMLKETCLNELKRNLPKLKAEETNGITETNVSAWSPSLFHSADQQASNQKCETTLDQKQAFQ